MFSTDTPPQARRKSFKAFTDQLINPSQKIPHPLSNLARSSMSLNPPPAQSNNAALPSDHQPQTDRNKLPPSAALILGQTAKLNPRLSRPSSSAITLSSVPYSYAYGAAGSPPQLSGKKLSNSAHTADTADSISPRSRSSRGRQAAPPVDDMSVASASSEKNYSEPARVRYARLNQRLQNTGSATAPSHSVPKVVLPNPSSTQLNDTSVNIASAFQRAQLAARSKKGNPQHPPSDRLNPSNQNHPTHPDQSQSPDPQHPIVINEDGPVHLDTSNEFSENLQSNRKRKKGRRSLDPSYKYRPGDSASSDSEAGEGIADKRLRREKKARLEQEQLEALSSNPKKSTSQRQKRKSARSVSSDELTDSDQDVGPGIAATRSRRIPKANQPIENQAEEGSRRKKDHSSRNNNASGTRTNDRLTDLHTDKDDGLVNVRTKRQSIQELDSDATRNLHPSATYFLSDPEASQPHEEEVPNHSHDLDRTTGTTDSSRLTLRLSGDSYDFAEEERIVKVLENQTRLQQPSKTTGVNRPDSDIAHISSPPSDQDVTNRDRVRSSNSSRRSDSGMREIEEVVASNSHSTHSKSAKPRLLPLPIPNQTKVFSPIIEESEPELAKAPRISLLDGIGTKLATQWNTLASLFLRSQFRTRLPWLVLLSSILLTLIINSIRTGDITISPFPLFSAFQKVRPTYSAPKAEIHNMEELIDRLKGLESAVSSMSSEHRSDTKNLEQSLHRDRKEFDYKVGRLELKLEEEEKLRSGLADKVQRKVDQGIQVLRSDLESVIVGHRHDHSQLEKVKDTVEGISGKIASSEYSNSNSVSREEVRVMMDQLLSFKGREEPMDREHLKQSVLTAIVKQINQDGYLTKADLGNLLEDELRAMAIGFEQQLDSKLQKLRQEIQSPRARVSNIGTGSDGEAMDRVQELIEEALQRYSLDQIGKRDFALYSGGARVIPQLTSSTYELSVKSWSDQIISFFTGAQSVLKGRGPATALSPETGLGMCWPISGSTGQIGIYLSRRILVTEVSIEHVDKSLAYELDSSPREIEVWSIEDSKKLLDIVYDPFESSRIQTFQIPSEHNYLRESQQVQASHPGDTEAKENTQSSSSDLPILRQGILFKIKSNHGNPYYTCIYRLRVHGLMESELNSNPQ